MKIIDKQREYFKENETKSLQFRLNTLRKLKNLIKLNEDLILKALKEDLGKSRTESYLTEIGIIYDEIRFMIKHLPKWVKKKKVRTPLVHFKAKSYLYREPYGVTLIISPWNYPFQLTMAPLIGAIAGGNTAVIKPSEYSCHTTSVISHMIKENFKEEYITVIQGGKEESQNLLNQSFDYIFFTGSVEVGKIVMEKASQHLTPVTLELGGKSPCIVYEDANLDLTAKKIVFGKFMNGGQTCVAPDYLLVHHKVKDQLLKKIKETIHNFYSKEPLKNMNFPKIITHRHFKRLIELIKNQRIIMGGKYDEEKLKIEPTLIEDISSHHPLMNEEIFGPILPVIEFNHLLEVINIIRNKPKPLALYLFTNDKKIQQDVLEKLSFGGGCINDTLIHLSSPYLPFGGVGESGIGNYHGKASFETFTHQKSILKKRKWLDVNIKYPPYDEKKLKLIKKILK